MKLTDAKERSDKLPKIIIFLQEMYKSSTIPFCILDEAFQIVWRNYAMCHICPEMISPEVLSHYIGEDQDFCDCFQANSVFTPLGFVIGKIPIKERYYYMQTKEPVDKNDWRNPGGSLRALNAFESVMRKEISTIFQGLKSAEHPDLEKIEHGTDNIYRTMLMTNDYTRLLGGMYSNIQIQIELHSFLISILKCAGKMIEASGTKFLYTCSYEIKYISTQPILVATILCHLLSNAVRHGAEKNTVHVKVVTHETELQVSISNQSNGIPVDTLSHIYEPYQSYSFSDFNTFPGYGLGLTIAQTGAIFLGGSVSNYSEEGQTVFRLTLPLNSCEINHSELDNELPGYADYQSFVKIFLADCL